MSMSRWSNEGGGRMDSGAPLVAVAIDHSKGSQNALRWAVDNLVSRGQTLTLVHVKVTSHPAPFHDGEGVYMEPTDATKRDLFLPFRCFCTRKDVNCKNVLVEETDVSKGIIDFVSHAAVEKLVIGAPSKGGFVVRFKSHEISNNINKGAPDFCTVYIIAKGKVASVRNAIRAAPAMSPLRAQIQSQSSRIHSSTSNRLQEPSDASFSSDRFQHEDSIRLSFGSGMRTSSAAKSYEFSATSDADVSFVSSGRPSVDQNPRLSGVSDFDRSFESSRTPMRYLDSYTTGTGNDFSMASQGSSTSWTSSQHVMPEDVEEEMRRLRKELQQTMDLYNAACKEAVAAKQKASQLQRWKIEEEKRKSEASIREEATVVVAEEEKEKNKAFVEAAKAENRLAELEAQKRIDAKEEMGNSGLGLLLRSDLRYRRYSIEEIEEATEYFAAHRKIGEGGYGPVYKCHLDHTPVAVKVLRPDTEQGKSQFHQEIEVLSCIRHPHMVLLLGACPEYGCLVYEHMANGSLDDRLFRRGSTPAIPWQHRFRIATEITTALLFLHRMKPEPLVHRDLKPANILLDRNFVSKIGDVGLARLLPPSIADVTQYRMTSTAGTLCYIDPEYQQTGMLGVKSDIYSLGVLLLQLVTAKPPMGLTHHVSQAIENGTLADILDPAVPDWPLAEAQRLAELSLQCAELRRKDRPDLHQVVLPELQKLQLLGEEDCMPQWMMTRSNPSQGQVR